MIAEVPWRERLKSQASAFTVVGPGTAFDVRLAISQAFGACRAAARTVSSKFAVLPINETGHVRDIIGGRDSGRSGAVRECVDRRAVLNSMICTRTAGERPQCQDGETGDDCGHLPVDYARTQYVGFSLTICE
jgi:hypothetical protein